MQLFFVACYMCRLDEPNSIRDFCIGPVGGLTEQLFTTCSVGCDEMICSPHSYDCYALCTDDE